MKKAVLKKKKKVVHHRSKFKARGFSKVAVLGIAAVILVAGGGYYVINQQKGGSALPSLVKPALNPNCEYKDPDLCKFVNNLLATTEYSVTMTSEVDGIKSESLMELAGEGKFHMRSKQNGKDLSNVITLGDTMYTLDYKDNKWWKQTLAPEVSGTPERNLNDEYAFKKEDFKDNTTYKFIAKEACGDKNCFKYEMINNDYGDEKMVVWFDDSEYLMRKMHTEMSGKGSSDAVYTYKGINITTPSPVKEGQPNGYGGAAMPNVNDPEVQKMMKEYQNQAPTNDNPVDNSVPDSEEY